MTELKQIYKCDICGNIVEILHIGADALVCCGQSMKLIEAKTQDQGMEKHVPIIEKTESGYLVKVGMNEHPMESGHFIEWIELIADGVCHRKNLKPNEKPEALFCINAKTINARAYCNIHGLWKS